jgi:predicted GH43/DUF377 family glycosyl hydrolase
MEKWNHAPLLLLSQINRVIMAFCALVVCGCLAAATAAAAGQPKVPPGFFPWQFPTANALKTWKYESFNKKRWWGDFPRNLKRPKHMFKKYPWAIGPFTKYQHNPVLAPSPGEWDCGHLGGGVHNGAVIFHKGLFYYIYRGERPWPGRVNYICDIGIATSPNGKRFTKIRKRSGLFRHGTYRKYSYEDVDVSRYHGLYYLFCNQWDWKDQENNHINGTFLATSTDLIHWHRRGIVFPDAKRVHRNAVILQTPYNRAVKVNGKFIMYLDNGLVATSSDMLHWKTRRQTVQFPGGETCFALANYSQSHPNRMLLFTGGNHTGHFYAIGEALFSKSDPFKMTSYLPRPVLAANPKIPYEHGFSATNPKKLISTFSDCIFFTGLTEHAGKYWVYYGGSEYYTCLATAAVHK